MSWRRGNCGLLLDHRLGLNYGLGLNNRLLRNDSLRNRLRHWLRLHRLLRHHARLLIHTGVHSGLHTGVSAGLDVHARLHSRLHIHTGVHSRLNRIHSRLHAGVHAGLTRIHSRVRTGLRLYLSLRVLLRRSGCWAGRGNRVLCIIIRFIFWIAQAVFSDLNFRKHLIPFREMTIRPDFLDFCRHFFDSSGDFLNVFLAMRKSQKFIVCFGFFFASKTKPMRIRIKIAHSYAPESCLK